MKYAVAVDIGATQTRVALGNDEGEILELHVFKTSSFPGPDEYLRHIAGLALSLEKKHGVEVEGIGVGSPGPLDMKKGEVLKSVNMPFDRLPVVSALKSLTGKKVAFANDAVTAAVGEKYWGAGRGLENLVYVTISTGIGAGIYVDGELLLGKHGNAHEVGHVVVDSGEEMTCGCGKKGHWEAYCSGSGIPRYAKFLAARNPELWEKSPLKSREPLTAKDVFDAFREGDALARLVMERVRKFNAYGFAVLVNVYDPEIITVGGSVALNNPDVLLAGLKEEVEKYALNVVPEIRLTPLGDKIGVLGALALGLGLEKKVPLV
ncbi:ROK family protein [Thermofilum pendens]|uniref:Glucokinase n=1 Tax=Thermofilum pendens (strain DSM 2475 / Hrk 5) TaxID=368408 RepID=A1RYM2_THEPD|nr:ROK family protein [Thermofilum pendens]ABL78302.1 glucokinase [Thermofilum pendens Hrk 5]